MQDEESMSVRDGRTWTLPGSDQGRRVSYNQPARFPIARPGQGHQTVTIARTPDPFRETKHGTGSTASRSTQQSIGCRAARKPNFPDMSGSPCQHPVTLRQRPPAGAFGGFFRLDARIRGGVPGKRHHRPLTARLRPRRPAIFPQQHHSEGPCLPTPRGGWDRAMCMAGASGSASLRCTGHPGKHNACFPLPRTLA